MYGRKEGSKSPLTIGHVLSFDSLGRGVDDEFEIF